MRKQVLALSAALIAASTAPALAERPVAPWELDSFVGKTLKGRGHAPLGIVGAADTLNGVIQVVGPQGQVATIHNSMLVSTGSANLQAPILTIGDVAGASTFSTSRIPLVAPRIIVGEPVPGQRAYDQYGRPLYNEYGDPLYYDE